MQAERSDEHDRAEAGRDDRPAGGGPAAAELDPEHDETTSREAYERQMAEEGRSDEAARHGDHIE